MTTHKRWNGSQYVPIPLGPNGESHLALRPDDTTIHRANKAPSWRNLYEKIGTDFTQQESKTGFGRDGFPSTRSAEGAATGWRFSDIGHHKSRISQQLFGNIGNLLAMLHGAGGMIGNPDIRIYGF